MLSQQSKYALRAMMFLDGCEDAEFIRVEEIARHADLPGPFLAKILKALAEERILLSRRGKNGGVQLNRRRGEISFYDICESVDDPIVKSECVLFKRPCNKQSPCPFHAEWSETKARLLHFLQTTKLNM